MNHGESSSKHNIHTCKCKERNEFSQNTLKMIFLAIILMMSVGTGDFYPSGHVQYYLEGDPPAQAMRALRGTDVRSRAGLSSPKLTFPSAHISMGVTNPALDAGPHQRTWWWSSERPYTKRRQNLAYYNLNSFGLRYGKREQNVLAEFKQKIPLQ